MRNAERGTRNTRVGVAARGLTQLFRVPTSAFRLCLFVAACTPITTRPDFRPDPRALTVVLDARPERVTTVLDSLVAAESLEVARANVRDGYVETAWYDTQAHRTRHHEREITNLAPTVKIRFWADPWAPGQPRLATLPVYRPRSDPLAPGGDLGLIRSKDREGCRVRERVLDMLKLKLGVPKAAKV